MTDENDAFPGPPMTSLGTSGRTAQPGAASLVLRPFGYLALTVLWLIIFLVCVGVCVALPFGLSFGGPLSEAPGIHGLSGPGDYLGLSVAMLLAAAIFGYVVVFLPMASFSLTMLAATFFVRSLRPGFRRERLSTTRWSEDAIGPVRIGQLVDVEGLAARVGIRSRYLAVMDRSAISLLPVRSSAWSRFWVSGMVFGLIPSFRMILSAFWVGAAYILTTGWILWPVESPVLVVVWMATTVVLVAFGVFRVVRAIRRSIAMWAVVKTKP